MRDDPIDGSRPDPRWGAHSVYPVEPDPTNPLEGIPPLDYPGAQPAKKKRRWGRLIVRGLAAFIVLFVVLVGWLAVTAPLSKSLQPPTPPSVTLLASDGTPIAKRGAILGKPVDASKLPKYVTGAFISIEDRRFYSHWGIDPRGIGRALFRNIGAGGVREGASTITQQLAKNAFLNSDRTTGRKLREVLISFWLEAWLSKNEILSRYLSNVYFGDNVYGLTAATEHYFNCEPNELSISQAAMLAGLVKAPSKLAPTGNLKGARDREKVVLATMVDTGVLTKIQADGVRLATPRPRPAKLVPEGTYFADWVLPEARDTAGDLAQETTVTTTLDRRLQRAAEHVVKRAGLRQAQVAIVAMRPDGRVVAMVGGKDYATSPFNRATQARRQPGSTFKLFVYLAAMRAGMTPDDMIEDEPVTIAGWSPKNSEGTYEGKITLRRAFQKSSNVAAARLIQKLGPAAVIKAARDLGISTPIPNEATIALGTSTVSLLELTSAFAAVAGDGYPVGARGIEASDNASWYDRLVGTKSAFGGKIRDEMLDLLSASATSGTGRQAALSVPTYGKTGTTQDSRDALFIGFAKDLVVGVWVGNDDNTPNPGLSGGGIPARIWKDFMQSALGIAPPPPPAAEPAIDDNSTDGNVTIDTGAGSLPVEGSIEGLGVNLQVKKDGTIKVSPAPDTGDRPPRPPADQADER
ncbi:PBP1A family penicillin-binding protein [Sphingomonas sp.]|jgi:penicillin-binding protein 1A|uniref:transglycosylase domain-containing protein n=1 Tax=Sphingomonas sp. TaxID=28214 RepID=UPI002E321969|nr:PBP1A family penicillin-binding protein [Sphingomonas sp.]HEX4693031.1 PBP1A family penicillin-binding protein [Sphingomonas sp.]